MNAAFVVGSMTKRLVNQIKALPLSRAGKIFHKYLCTHYASTMHPLCAVGKERF